MGTLFGASIGMLVGMMLFGPMGGCIEERKWQSRAIDHGAAVWAIDPKTGETEFVWLKCERETTTAKGE